MAYIVQANLEARVSRSAVLVLFDDGDGTVDTEALGEVIQSASDLVDSWVARSYGGPFPLPADPVSGKYPAIVREATLRFAIWMSYGRHPEYVKTYGEDNHLSLVKSAEELCDRIAQQMNLIVETSQPKTDMGQGGLVTDDGPRMVVTNADGTTNYGDF